jgi:hypothetical protein
MRKELELASTLSIAIVFYGIDVSKSTNLVVGLLQ